MPGQEKLMEILHMSPLLWVYLVNSISLSLPPSCEPWEKIQYEIEKLGVGGWPFYLYASPRNIKTHLLSTFYDIYLKCHWNEIFVCEIFA